MFQYAGQEWLMPRVIIDQDQYTCSFIGPELRNLCTWEHSSADTVLTTQTRCHLLPTVAGIHDFMNTFCLPDEVSKDCRWNFGESQGSGRA